MRILIATLLTVGMGACSESHPPMPPGAPFPGDIEELDLTDEEYLELTTWWAGQFGWPEETRLTCGAGSTRLTNPADTVAYRTTREEFPDCHVLVQSWYDCAASGVDWCAGATARPPECRRPAACAPAGVDPVYNP